MVLVKKSPGDLSWEEEVLGEKAATFFRAELFRACLGLEYGGVRQEIGELLRGISRFTARRSYSAPFGICRSTSSLDCFNRGGLYPRSGEEDNMVCNKEAMEE